MSFPLNDWLGLGGGLAVGGNGSAGIGNLCAIAGCGGVETAGAEGLVVNVSGTVCRMIR